ncbi:MAG: hypothetical protein HYV41_05540 [Candidatus Magasanikbacteria bacterium]|nr:hypothetical protein [Candidatus Magasanikbacteria bacterium]
MEEIRTITEMNIIPEHERVALQRLDELYQTIDAVRLREGEDEVRSAANILFLKLPSVMLLKSREEMFTCIDEVLGYLRKEDILSNIRPKNKNKRSEFNTAVANYRGKLENFKQQFLDPEYRVSVEEIPEGGLGIFSDKLGEDSGD